MRSSSSLRTSSAHGGPATRAARRRRRTAARPGGGATPAPARRDALAPGAAGAAAAMLQALGVVRQFGMDDETETGQVDAARRDVGRDADPRAAVAQAPAARGCARSGRARPTARRRRTRARAAPAACDAPHRACCRTRCAPGEHRPAQHVDDRVLDLVRHDAHRAIFDVGMPAARRRHRERASRRADSARPACDAFRQRRREQKRAALGRRRLENDLEILAEAEVEHLVGFVEHQRRAAARGRGGRARDGRADGPACRPRCGAGRELPRLAPRVHAADAGHDARPLRRRKASQARAAPASASSRVGATTERQRRPGASESLSFAEQLRRHRQPVGDGLARAGLRRDQQSRALPTSGATTAV